MNPGANPSIGGVPLGSISPRSAMEVSNISSEPIKHAKKNNKRSKKNKGTGVAGRES
jgi:hypothetical protein